MNQARSDHRVRKVIAKLRQCHRPALLYGMAPEQGEEWLRKETEPLLSAVEPFLQKHTARCCVLELCRHYRKLYGPYLAEHLELTIAKFEDMGLNQETLAQLLVAIDEAVGPRLEAGNARDRKK
jgi:hypothetical protein